MLPNVESLRRLEESAALPPSAADYLLLGAALAVPLYTTSLTILQPFSGIIYVVLCWWGISTSYMMRNAGKPSNPALINRLAYIQVALAILVIANLDVLNGAMPGRGFPWQMAPAAFMCWFLIGASFFLWTDAAMLFLLVPALALFGIQSYIETNANFAISMSLFMVSVAVLLTRLHLRTMKGLAVHAGFTDFDQLYRGPWKGVAGPALAVASVLGIAVASLAIAPGLGTAVRKLAGEPEIRFDSPRRGNRIGEQAQAAKRIGVGPITASNMPVMEVRGDLTSTYLRGEIYGTYIGTGFMEKRDVRSNTLELEPTGEAPKAIRGASVYRFADNGSPGIPHRVVIEGLARRQSSAYIPPGPLRKFEFDGEARAYRNELIYMRDPFTKGQRYEVETSAPVATPEVLRAAPPTDRRNNLRHNTGPYGDQIPLQVRDLAARVAQRGATDYDDVVEFIREIQSRVRYNLQAEEITGSQDRVEAFLFDTQEGYCDLFAASLTVMCRAVGLEARPVSGYLAPPEEEDDGAIIVRDRNAHMWTEVFFPTVGWVIFDATAGARVVPGGEVGALLDDPSDSAGAAFAAVIGGAVFGLSFLGLLAGAFWPRLKELFARRSPERRAAPYYHAYLRALQPVVKRPKHPSETVREYAAAYVAVRPEGSDAVILAAMLDRAVFSKASLSADEWANLRARTASLAAASKKHAHAS